MTIPMSYPIFKAFDNNGTPLAGGKLYTYVAGTSTPKITYQDTDLIIPHTNPIILDSNGESEIYTEGVYKFILKNSTDSTTFWTIDDYEYAQDISNYKLYCDPDNTDQGAIGNGYSLKDLIDLLGITFGTIVLQHNKVATTTEYALTTSETIPANITLEIENGAIINGSGDLTVEGNIDVLTTQHFYDGTGNVLFKASAADYIYPAWWGFKTSASAAVNKNAIEEAIASLPTTYGGKIQLPLGFFAVSPDIEFPQKNITISGCGTGYGYEETKTGTTVYFAGVGTYGFDMGVTNNSGNYGKIDNLSIVGTSNLSYGVGMYGACVLEDMSVAGCNLAGIKLANGGNQTHLNRVSSGYNIGAGLTIDEGIISTTTLTANNSNFRRNQVGISIASCRGLSFNNCVIESNYGLGLAIYKSLTKVIANINFTKCWFENNDDTAPRTGYQVKIWSEDSASLTNVPTQINFTECSINSENAHKHIDLTNCRYVTFKDSYITGGDTVNGLLIGTYASFVTFEDGETLLPVGNYYGNRGFYFNKKVSGDAGFSMNASLFKTGGRTQTFYFVADTIVAGTTQVAYPTIYNAAGKTLDLDCYPIHSFGSILGINMAKRNALAAGSLTIRPFYRTAWTSSSYNWSGCESTITSASGTDNVISFTPEVYTFPEKYLVGIQLIADASFDGGANNQIVVGLTLEY